MHYATYNVLLRQSDIIFRRFSACLTAVHRCWISFFCLVVGFNLCGLSVTISRAGDSVRQSLESVLGIPSSSTASVCGVEAKYSVRCRRSGY